VTYCIDHCFLRYAQGGKYKGDPERVNPSPVIPVTRTPLGPCPHVRACGVTSSLCGYIRDRMPLQRIIIVLKMIYYGFTVC
jgi:hypothetical protein